MALSGCFHPDALNTYCTDPFEYTKCVWSEKLPTFHTVATNNLGVCKFFNAPSPPPQAPGTGNVIKTVETRFVLEGAVSDFPTSVTDPLAQKILAVSSATPSSYTTTVASASVQVTFAFTFADESSQSSFNSEVNSAMGNAADASNVLGIPVASVSIATVNVVIDDDDNVAVIVGAVVGGFFGLLLLAGVAIMIKRKQSKVEA